MYIFIYTRTHTGHRAACRHFVVRRHRAERANAMARRHVVLDLRGAPRGLPARADPAVYGAYSARRKESGTYYSTTVRFRTFVSASTRRNISHMRLASAVQPGVNPYRGSISLFERARHLPLVESLSIISRLQRQRGDAESTCL